MTASEEPGEATGRVPSLAIRRDYLDLGLVAVAAVGWLTLMGPLADLRAFVAPLFLFLLPGSAVVLLVKRNLSGPIELIAASFVISTFLIFCARVVLAVLSRTISSSSLIDGVVIWTLPLLVAAYIFDTWLRPRRSLSLERWDLWLIVVLVILYVGMSVFVLRATYTPTPDELAYLLNARTFNFESAIPVIDSTKVWPVNFVLARPLWFVSLASYLLASSDSPFSGQVLSALFFSMLVLATYRVGRRVLGGQVGLIAGILLAVSPSLLVWGSTVLLDVPFAVFLVLGYGYFLNAIQMKGGTLVRIAAQSLVLAVLCFLLSFMVKLADPVLPVLVYLYFVYLVWRSELPSKRLILSVLITLPALYLAVDGLYNLFTYVVPNAAIHNLIRPFLPVSFFERFFAFFYQGSAYKSGSALSLWGILQGIYLAGISPYLITYPILFMSIAGVIMMLGHKGGLAKGHGLFSLVVVGLVSFLASLLLFSFEIARNVLYIYSFIVVAAAAGFRFSLQSRRLPEFVLSAGGLVLFALVVETSMLGVGISLGAIPAPNQYAFSLLTINFFVGAGILAWKVIECLVSGQTANRSAGSRAPLVRWSKLVTIGLVCLLCFSQFVVFAQTGPYRSTSNFDGLTSWLDTHVGTGDVLFTNGQDALTSLLNDSTLRSLEHGSIHLFPVPNNTTALLRLTNSSPNAYLVLFKQAEYTDTDTYSSRQFFMQGNPSSISLMNSTNYQVYAVSGHIASTLSTINVETVDLRGDNLSGYYVTLWQSGVRVNSCFSACSFTVDNGQSYQIFVSSYGNEKFSYWQNDGSTGYETVNVPAGSSSISLTAVFTP